MDTGEILTESIVYSRKTFEGKWVRWLIFIILSLPMALFPFVFDAEKLVDKTTADFHWDLVPWDQVAVLLIAAFICSFLISGYMVRIYRGVKPSPDFDDWGSLFLDGLKLSIVTLLWFLPILMVTLVLFAIAIGAGMSAGAGSGHIKAAQALEKTFAADGRVAEVVNNDALQYTNKLFRDFYSRF